VLLILSIDPFLKKEWYEIKTPSYFPVRNIGKTIVNRTAGLKIASDALKGMFNSVYLISGRVIDVTLADLNNNQEDTFRKYEHDI
jgi:small subunit ribosomal protein S3Ae